MQLGQLASQCGLPLSTEHLGQGSQGSLNPMHSLEEHECPGLGCERFETRPALFRAPWQKSLEDESVGRQSGNTECRRHCRGSRHADDGEPGGLSAGHELKTRITDQRRTGIRDQPKLSAPLEFRQQFRRLCVFIMLVQRPELLVETEMRQEPPAASRILDGDKIDCGQHFSCPQAEICEVTDRRRNDIENSGRFCAGIYHRFCLVCLLKMKLWLYSVICLSAALLAACTCAPVVSPVDITARESQAQAAFDSGDFVTARLLYTELVERTRGAEKGRFQIGLARAEVALGSPESALAILSTIPGPVPATVDPNVTAVRASAYFALGQAVEAVRLLVEREIWLESSAEIIDNQLRIWNGLAEQSNPALARQRTGDTTVDGWLALAPLTRLSNDSARFLSALIEWREEFGSHPATGRILAERLATLRGEGLRPGKIALLLPLSSEVRPEALAIQAGFFAAHLASGYADESSIEVYDTARRGSVESFFTAQIEGADFIVGPLLNNAVEDVQEQAGFIPTLALNLGEQESVATPNFFQFALSSDDEVEAIAARAIADGHKTAAILYASSDRGYEQRDRFRTAFEARGGQVINAVAYVSGSENLSAPIEELLNIAQSESRFERLQANLQRNIEFEPRRRADIDMIFLQLEPAGGNVDARLLVPLFKDNDADPTDIPTFATRDIYNPTRQGGDPDLNGLVFPDVPLLVDPTGGAQAALSRLTEFSTASAYQHPRLFAFGFDAYQLVNALSLKTDASWPLSGATGELYLGVNGRIRRVLPLAEFRGGQPQPLGPSVRPADPR